MTTAKQLTPPAPLDTSNGPVHPSDVSRWKAEWQTYHESLRRRDAEADAQRQAAQEAAARTLTTDEYHALAVARHEEAQRRLAEREAASKAQAEAEAAYLASMPEIAEVTEASEFLLLTKLQHWFSLGYQVHENSVQFFAPGCYSVSLKKPATTKSKGK